MKKILTLFILFLLSWTSFAYQEYINKNIDWKTVSLIKVVLDWKHKIVTAVSDSWDTLENLVNNEWWISGINWAYFCPTDYSQCWWYNHTDSDRVYKWEIHSKYWSDLWARWMFWFNQSWEVLFILNNLWYVSGINKKLNEDKLWELYYWISNFPVLLVNWENVINESMNLVETKMSTKWPKSFICSKQDWKTIVMWSVSDMTVPLMPDYIKKNFDCYNAINLDNWWSLGMIYNNKIIKKPWRKIMDAFVIVEVKETPKLNTTNQSSNIKVVNWVNTNLSSTYDKSLKDFYDKLNKINDKDPNAIKNLILKIAKIKENLKKNSTSYEVLSKIQDYCNKLDLINWLKWKSTQTTIKINDIKDTQTKSNNNEEVVIDSWSIDISEYLDFWESLYTPEQIHEWARLENPPALLKTDLDLIKSVQNICLANNNCYDDYSKIKKNFLSVQKFWVNYYWLWDKTYKKKLSKRYTMEEDCNNYKNDFSSKKECIIEMITKKDKFFDTINDKNREKEFNKKHPMKNNSTPSQKNESTIGDLTNSLNNNQNTSWIELDTSFDK